MLWYSLRLVFVYFLKIVIKTKYDRKKKKKNKGVLFHDIFIDLPAWRLLISLNYRLVASDWANVNIMISVFDVTCDAPYTLWFICFCTLGLCFFFVWGNFLFLFVHISNIFLMWSKEEISFFFWATREFHKTRMKLTTLVFIVDLEFVCVHTYIYSIVADVTCFCDLEAENCF